MTTLMTATTTASPTSLNGTGAYLRMFSVDEYHRMIDAGILTEDDPVELLEGQVVIKMARNPLHDASIQRSSKRLNRVLPIGWEIRIQSGVTLDRSEPEPDLALVMGDDTSFVARHPFPSDIGLLAEVSESSLARDREVKGPIYARNNIPVYWIINLVDRQVEVHTLPVESTYTSIQVFRVTDSVPLILDGATIAMIPVAELLP